MTEAEQDVVLDAIRKAWRRHPSMRLCQLIVNATCSSDPFYVEDAGLVASLDSTWGLSPDQ